MLQSAYFPSFLLFYFAFILRDGIFFSALAGANLLGSMILPASASQVAGAQLQLLYFVIQIWTRCFLHCRHWTESSYSFLVTHVHTLNMQAQNSLLLLSVPVTLPTDWSFSEIIPGKPLTVIEDFWMSFPAGKTLLWHVLRKNVPNLDTLSSCRTCLYLDKLGFQGSRSYGDLQNRRGFHKAQQQCLSDTGLLCPRLWKAPGIFCPNFLM